MYKITFDYPNMPKGQEITIPGLGTYTNGSTTSVSKEEADAFRVYQTDVGMPDQTLLKAFQGAEYVTVETDKEDDAPKPKRDPAAPPAETVTPPAEPPHVKKKDGDQ